MAANCRRLAFVEAESSVIVVEGRRVRLDDTRDFEDFVDGGRTKSVEADEG